MASERSMKTFCTARFRMPSAFSTPIMEVFSRRIISIADTMFRKATSSMMTMMTAALTLWARSQSKVLGLRLTISSTFNTSEVRSALSNTAP